MTELDSQGAGMPTIGRIVHYVSRPGNYTSTHTAKDDTSVTLPAKPSR